MVTAWRDGRDAAKSAVNAGEGIDYENLEPEDCEKLVDDYKNAVNDIGTAAGSGGRMVGTSTTGSPAGPPNNGGLINLGVTIYKYFKGWL